MLLLWLLICLDLSIWDYLVDDSAMYWPVLFDLRNIVSCLELLMTLLRSKISLDS